MTFHEPRTSQHTQVPNSDCCLFCTAPNLNGSSLVASLEDRSSLGPTGANGSMPDHNVHTSELISLVWLWEGAPVPPFCVRGLQLLHNTEKSLIFHYITHNVFSLCARHWWRLVFECVTQYPSHCLYLSSSIKPGHWTGTPLLDVISQTRCNHWQRFLKKRFSSLMCLTLLIMTRNLATLQRVGWIQITELLHGQWYMGSSLLLHIRLLTEIKTHHRTKKPPL